MKKFLIGLLVLISLPLIIVTQFISVLCATLRFVLEWIEYAIDWLFNWEKGLVDSQISNKEE
ncbi:MAG: hypothetical protein MJZ64_07560 [Paludibacteraceae bacterium]|nr:hypothetical protein [Paludibacteraceae bacterium]